MKTGIFSFFAGAGFLDLGFETTQNFETVFVNEFHAPFMEIYQGAREGFKEIPHPRYGHHIGDITNFLKKDEAKFLKQSMLDAKQNFDLIGFIGGPPCPDFSVAGKNKGIKGENGILSSTYIELITKNLPDFFLFENVKGLYRTKIHREFFESMKNKLIQNGYCLTEKLINALEYGAPQDRERIILIGFKKETLKTMGLKVNGSTIPSFCWDEKNIYNAKDVLNKPWPSLDKFKEGSVTSPPAKIIKKLTVEYWFQKNKVEEHPNSKHHFTPRAGLVKFKKIDEGDDLKKSYKRLHRWRYSPTAAYGNNEVHIHPYKARRISAAEALAVQSLPKNFVIPSHISLTNMFKTIGNGVPYLAAKGLAETILYFIENTNDKKK
ncbi:MAG: DNA cytosine methyltransferase [Fibrobacterales bacterium]